MEHILRGDSVIKKKFTFKSMDEKLEEATVHYNKAIAKFTMNRDYLNLAKTYEKMGDWNVKIDNYVDAVDNYKKSIHNYEQIDLKKYIEVCLEKLIPLYEGKNKIDDMGDVYIKIAKNSNDDEVYKYFSKALVCFESVNSPKKKTAYMEFAEFLISIENYEEAINVTDKLIAEYMDSYALRLVCSKHEYMNLLCYLLIKFDDVIYIQKKIDEYLTIDPSLENKPQYKFIVKLFEICSNPDPDKFTDCVTEYNSTNTLSNTEVSLLLKIKNKVINAVDELIDVR